MCSPNDKVLVPIPATMMTEHVAEVFLCLDGLPLHPEYGINENGSKCFRLDRCIVPAIEALWDAGIQTSACCCGHRPDGQGVISLLCEPFDNDTAEVRRKYTLQAQAWEECWSSQPEISGRDDIGIGQMVLRPLFNSAFESGWRASTLECELRSSTLDKEAFSRNVMGQMGFDDTRAEPTPEQQKALLRSVPDDGEWHEIEPLVIFRVLGYPLGTHPMSAMRDSKHRIFVLENGKVAQPYVEEKR